MQCPSAAWVLVANGFACNELAFGFGGGKDRAELGTVGGGQHAHAMIANADLNVPALVLGELDEDLAEFRSR